MKTVTITGTALPVFPPTLTRVEGATNTTIMFHLSVNGQHWAIESDLTFPFIFAAHHAYRDGDLIVQKIQSPVDRAQLFWGNIRFYCNGQSPDILPDDVINELIKYGPERRCKNFEPPASDSDPFGKAEWGNDTRMDKHKMVGVPNNIVSEISVNYLATLRHSLFTVLTSPHIKITKTPAK